MSRKNRLKVESMSEIPVVSSNWHTKIGMKKTIDAEIGTRNRIIMPIKRRPENPKSTIRARTDEYGMTSRGKATFLRRDALSTSDCVAPIIDVWRRVQGKRAAYKKTMYGISFVGKRNTMEKTNE